MKRRRYPIPLKGTALSLSKEPALSERSESKGRCGKLSYVNNFALRHRTYVHHGKLFSEKVINKKLLTQVILTDHGHQVKREFHSRLIEHSIRTMLFALSPLRYD